MTAWNSTAAWTRKAFDKLMQLLRYVDGDYADIAHLPAGAADIAGAPSIRSHYLAIPPSLFGKVLRAIESNPDARDGRAS